MWARLIEMIIGFWLVLSSFIFRHQSVSTNAWMLDFIFGTAVIVPALLSFCSPTRRKHLLGPVVALAMIGFGYYGSTPPLSPTEQNYIATGFCVLIFSMIPNQSSIPKSQEVKARI